MRYFDRNGFYLGLGTALIVAAAIFLGSQGLRNFDFALTTYAVGSIFAGFSVAYRYGVWAQRPPTWMYIKRGWTLFLRNGISGFRKKTLPISVAANTFTLGRLLLENFFLQKFIGKRSYQRWIMHACLSWGGMLAFAITFPLVFGWVHFQTTPDNAEIYRIFVFGHEMDHFNIHTIKAFIFFNMLNFSAILVLIGLALAIKLRMSDRGEVATQTFADDVMPLFLLFLVAGTGLMLTVSAKFMAGNGFAFIGMSHVASVIALLLYLPFGKLFHIFQRTASLGVSFYKKAGETGPRANCQRCGEDYASQMHIADLKTVLDQLGFDFRFATPQGELHYQDICPTCRRRLLALNQGKSVGR